MAELKDCVILWVVANLKKIGMSEHGYREKTVGCLDPSCTFRHYTINNPSVAASSLRSDS
jgi:hypothetical protein